MTITYNPFKIIHGVVTFIATFMSTQWRQYNQLGQMLFVFAVLAIAVDAGVAYKYGWSMTWLHGVGFAIVAIAFCLLPDVAVTEWRKGNKAGSIPVAVCAVILGLVALQSHIGYGGGVRLKEMQQTGFQHAKASDVRDLAKSEAVNLDMWRKRLADKQAEYASLKEAAPWAATAKADGLKAELESIRERMAAEERGQRGRKAGRGAEFERLQNRANDLTARIASVERFNELGNTIADLEKQVAATQKIVDQKVATVANTGFESNVVVNQNDIIVSLVNFVRGVDPAEAIKPDEVQRVVANTAVTGFNSIGFLICAPLLMLAAGLNRRPEFFGGHGFVAAEPEPVTPMIPATSAALAPVTAPGRDTHTIERHTVHRETELAQVIAKLTAPYQTKTAA